MLSYITDRIFCSVLFSLVDSSRGSTLHSGPAPNLSLRRVASCNRWSHVKCYILHPLRSFFYAPTEPLFAFETSWRSSLNGGVKQNIEQMPTVLRVKSKVFAMSAPPLFLFLTLRSCPWSAAVVRRRLPDAQMRTLKVPLVWPSE